MRELCPGGVEHRALGECGEFIRGNGLQKSDLIAEGHPAVHYGQLHTTYGTWVSETVSFVAPSFAAKLRKAQPGDLLIATTSEDDDAVGKAAAWVGNGPVAVSGDAYIYRHGLEPKYVAYFFQTDQFRKQKRAGITGTKVRRISGECLAKISIPVPPLEVQREIVRVLDQFSKVEAELEASLGAELEARRVQYAYYRDSLLSFEGDATPVRWVPIGELGEIFRGKRFTKNDYVDEGGIGVIHYGEIYTYYGTSATNALAQVRPELARQLRFAQPGDVVIAGVGETVEDVAKAVAWLGDTEVAIHDDCFAFRSEEDPTYIAYAMQTASYHAQKEQYVARAKVKRVGAANLGKIVLPVPPIEEQRRIVGILDKFDALVNDLSIGLPAELAARRRQYEYYRDRLLTFEEAME